MNDPEKPIIMVMRIHPDDLKALSGAIRREVLSSILFAYCIIRLWFYFFPPLP